MTRVASLILYAVNCMAQLILVHYQSCQFHKNLARYREWGNPHYLYECYLNIALVVVSSFFLAWAVFWMLQAVGVIPA